MPDAGLMLCNVGEIGYCHGRNYPLTTSTPLQHTTVLSRVGVSRVKTKADGQLHGRRSSNEVRVERYRRPDAPVLGCWIRVKLNAASRCDHWDAVMAVLVLLRGPGQGAFLQEVKPLRHFAYVCRVSC